MTPTLVKRRISVPAPHDPGLVDRERLEGRIAGLVLTHGLVVVSAMAGTGKTTAVARSVRRLGLPVAWLSVDASDAASDRLLAYLAGALAACLPSTADATRAATARDVPPQEATELLLEAVGEIPAVLVLDGLEQIDAAAEDAWTVVEALVRHAPDTLRLVVVSRRAVRFATRAPTGDRVAWVTAEDLALDVGEVQDVLLAADSAVAPETVLEATGGWVTGVLHEAWRGARDGGSGSVPEPLHEYLATQVLGALRQEDQDFLVTTSLLDEVTVARAATLGAEDATRRLASLRQANLPARWSDGGRRLTCHPHFRAFLLSCLEARDPDEVRRLRRGLGRVLTAEGFAEAGVEELLTADAVEEAVAPAAELLPGLVERLDLDVAGRWLTAFDQLQLPPAKLVESRLTIAAGREDFSRIVEIADGLTRTGRFAELVSGSGQAAALIAWAFVHAGRLEEVHRVLDVVPAGAEAQAIEYMLGLFDPAAAPGPRVPALSGSPLDALVLRTHYVYGHLDQLMAPAPAGWVDVVASPFRIAALRALGRVTEADELLDEALEADGASLGLLAVWGPEVRLDAGRTDDAWALVERTLRTARAQGSELFAGLNRCVAAKIALRGRADAALALTILDDLRRSAIARYPYVDELLRTWRGAALLEQGRDEHALAELEVAVESMVRGSRILDLPTAAVHLAEARWRTGDPTGSDAAADLALETSRRYGSDHLLLEAIRPFPSVLSRRIDATPGTDSPWHALGRSLQASEPSRERTRAEATVHVRDLGRPSLLVDGVPTSTRIRKTLELLCFLMLVDGHRASREQLLDALFDGRADASSRSYLRTAIHWMKLVLPGTVQVETTDDVVGIGRPELIRADSFDALGLLRDAGRLQGAGKSHATRAALALVGRGEFLAGCDSIWVNERRREIAQRADDARHLAAELSYSEGRLAEALKLTGDILENDRYREAVWRLQMRVLGALGDEDGVIATYRRCQTALGELGTEVAPATSALVTALRR